jgi:anti-sigma factor RsiW
MSDRFTEMLSDYLDGGLDDSARKELTSHVRGCPECAETLEDLRLVVARAHTLPERAPSPDVDLWPGIEARIRESARPAVVRINRGSTWTARRVSFSLPQIAAACLAVAVVSGGAVWYARKSGLEQSVRSGGLIVGTAETGEGGSALRLAVPSGADGARGAERRAGLEELRRILAEGRGKLDPATVRTLEESVTIIEIAIGQARRALEADPANPYVRAHLDKTMQRKVDLLRRATMLASAP